jgi:2,3-bisphosphoglycerate-independent phosphoglycerate mutase
MKYVVFVPDGCADIALDELDGRTPLEAAHLPNLQALAAESEVGRARVIPAGLPPGSDVGNMAILGYDPARYHTGRAPIEAAAMGVQLGADEVAYRCNLVTLSEPVPRIGEPHVDQPLVDRRHVDQPVVGQPMIMDDFAAGHVTSEQSHPIIAALDAALGAGRDGVRFHAGIEYRHLCVVPREWGDAECVPPHDLTGGDVVWPRGPAAPKLQRLMDASRAVVNDAARAVDSTATQIWLWGQGATPSLPSFAQTYGVAGRLTSAVDLVQGLGVLTGIEIVDVPGATAGFDNDYRAQADACLTSLTDRDFFLVHVEATDEAGHQGLAHVKVDALERWDADIIGPVVDALRASRTPFRVLLLPDHATPCSLRTHTDQPVPYLLFDSQRPGTGGTYSESGVARAPEVDAHRLMARLLADPPSS